MSDKPKNSNQPTWTTRAAVTLAASTAIVSGTVGFLANGSKPAAPAAPIVEREITTMDFDAIKKAAISKGLVAVEIDLGLSSDQYNFVELSDPAMLAEAFGKKLDGSDRQPLGTMHYTFSDKTGARKYDLMLYTAIAPTLLSAAMNMSNESRHSYRYGTKLLVICGNNNNLHELEGSIKILHDRMKSRLKGDDDFSGITSQLSRACETVIKDNKQLTFSPASSRSVV